MRKVNLKLLASFAFFAGMAVLFNSCATTSKIAETEMVYESVSQDEFESKFCRTLTIYPDNTFLMRFKAELNPNKWFNSEIFLPMINIDMDLYQGKFWGNLAKTKKASYLLCTNEARYDNFVLAYVLGSRVFPEAFAESLTEEERMEKVKSYYLKTGLPENDFETLFKNDRVYLTILSALVSMNENQKIDNSDIPLRKWEDTIIVRSVDKGEKLYVIHPKEIFEFIKKQAEN